MTQANMTKYYYLVMQGGLPIDVYQHEFNAVSSAKERSIPGRPATVMPVVAAQVELDFPVEDTKPDSAEDAPGCTCGAV